VRILYRWLEEEEELPNPMARKKPPIIPERPMDVLLVLGKGRRERALPFGHKAGEALERYLRVRARHKHADPPGSGLA